VPKHTGLLDHFPDGQITKLFHRLHDGDWVHETIQNCTPIAEANAEARNHCNPWNGDKSMRHDARIPMIYLDIWQKRYGINFLDSNPDVQKQVDKLLNDPEWRWMRTSNAQL
jgi:hypothetical protein